MKKVLLTTFLFVSLSAFAQNDTLHYKVDELRSNVKSLRIEIQDVKSHNANLSNRLEKIETRIENAEKSISDNLSLSEKTIASLEERLSVVKEDADTKIGNVGQSLSSTTIYVIIGGVAILLIIIIIYLLLRYKQKTDRYDFLQRIDKAKSSLEEDVVKEFSRHTELMASQLQSQPAMSIIDAGKEQDHSLALKLANEINLIERNLSFMDPGTKGLKQLQRSVDKLKDNLSANGYEMPVLLGGQYYPGMNMIISSSAPDEAIEKDKEIITKVLLPQVNYNGKIIQTAQIEVSVGI